MRVMALMRGNNNLSQKLSSAVPYRGTERTYLSSVRLPLIVSIIAVDVNLIRVHRKGEEGTERACGARGNRKAERKERFP